MIRDGVAYVLVGLDDEEKLVIEAFDKLRRESGCQTCYAAHSEKELDEMISGTFMVDHQKRRG